jgi:bacterioferritin-associated ferredoxin
MRDLTRELRVGTCCGKCIPEAKAALDACLGQHRDMPAVACFPAASAEFAV